jgi:hypothetical protein
VLTSGRMVLARSSDTAHCYASYGEKLLCALHCQGKKPRPGYLERL